MMQISFDLDIDDMLAFQSYYNENSKPFKKTLLFIRLFIPFVCLIVFLVFLLKGGLITPLYVMGGLYLLISIWWIVYMPGKIKKNTLKKNKKALQKQKQDDPTNFGYREMIFDDEGIRVKTSAVDFFTKWSKVKRIVKEDGYFFIFLSDREAFIIPMSKLSDIEIKSLNDIFNKMNLVI